MKRVQFDFSEDAYEKLVNLKEETKASSQAEVVRNALRLYEWYVTHVVREKLKLQVEGPNGARKEIQFL